MKRIIRRCVLTYPHHANIVFDTVTFNAAKQTLTFLQKISNSFVTFAPFSTQMAVDAFSKNYVPSFVTCNSRYAVWICCLLVSLRLSQPRLSLDFILAPCCKLGRCRCMYRFRIKSLMGVYTNFQTGANVCESYLQLLAGLVFGELIDCPILLLCRHIRYISSNYTMRQFCETWNFERKRWNGISLQRPDAIPDMPVTILEIGGGTCQFTKTRFCHARSAFFLAVSRWMEDLPRVHVSPVPWVHMGSKLQVLASSRIKS